MPLDCNQVGMTTMMKWIWGAHSSMLSWESYIIIYARTMGENVPMATIATTGDEEGRDDDDSWKAEDNEGGVREIGSTSTSRKMGRRRSGGSFSVETAHGDTKCDQIGCGSLWALLLHR